MEPVILKYNQLSCMEDVFRNDDILLGIISKLSYTILGSLATVSAQWNIILSGHFDKKREELKRQVSFSPDDWLFHLPLYSINEKVKKIPPNLDEIACPIHVGKRLMDTHVFTYCPEGLTLNKYIELLDKRESFYYIWDEILKNFGDITFETHGWKAMTKEEVPQSRGKDFNYQKLLVDKLNKTAIKVFRVPTVLEAIVCISLEFIKSGNKIFPHFARCQEDIEGCQLVVMDDMSGLRVISHNGQYFHGICIASIRDF